jgi:hypothetical protein
VRPEKERKMNCNHNKKYILPVFGKEPGTGIFIARRR